MLLLLLLLLVLVLLLLRASLTVRIANGRKRCISNKLLIVVLMLKCNLIVRRSWPIGPIVITILLLLSVLPTSLPVLILLLKVLPFSPLRLIPDQLRPLKAEMFPALVLTR